jgi:hypothetical protein
MTRLKKGIAPLYILSFFLILFVIMAVWNFILFYKENLTMEEETLNAHNKYLALVQFKSMILSPTSSYSVIYQCQDKYFTYMIDLNKLFDLLKNKPSNFKTIIGEKIYIKLINPVNSKTLYYDAGSNTVNDKGYGVPLTNSLFAGESVNSIYIPVVLIKPQSSYCYDLYYINYDADIERIYQMIPALLVISTD